MRSLTGTVILDVHPDRAFDWLARIENLGRWATEFVKSLEVTGEGEALASTPRGQAVIRFSTDRATGVIDIRVGPTREDLALYPCRIVPYGEGRSAFLFTMFRAADQDEAAFRDEYASLERELENVRRELEG